MTKLKHILTLDLRSYSHVYGDQKDEYVRNVHGVTDTGVNIYSYPTKIIFDGGGHFHKDFTGKDVESPIGRFYRGPLVEFTHAIWAKDYAAYSWGNSIDNKDYQSEQAFKDVCRLLSSEQKSKLTAHMQQLMETPEVLGVIYRYHQHKVELFGETWVTRKIGVACAVQESSHDYEIREISVFQPLEDNSLESPVLDGIKLLLPSEPILHKGGMTRGYKNFWGRLLRRKSLIQHKDKLVITDLAEPKKAYVWEIVEE